MQYPVSVLSIAAADTGEDKSVGSFRRAGLSVCTRGVELRLGWTCVIVGLVLYVGAVATLYTVAYNKGGIHDLVNRSHVAVRDAR